jgi:hypothetical protein
LRILSGDNVKNAFRFITVSLAIVALAACNQQTTAPTGEANSNLVLGMGEIPMVAAEGLETQVLSTGIDFSAANPTDGAAIDFSVDGPADIVFDEVNNVRYVRTRVSVTNNTGANITNLTLMGIAPRAGTFTTLSRLRDLIGQPLTQLEAFNASTVVEPTAIDPAFVPSPTHPVVINNEGGVEIINTRADFVAYDESGTDLDPVIAELNNLAANNPDFGLTGVNGTDFSLLPFGFQVGSLNAGATGLVDVTFSLPNDAEGVGESPLARFAVTFVAVQDTVGRVTQAAEEISTPVGNLDAGVGAAEQRLLNPVAAESNLTNVTTLVLLGSAERDITVPLNSVQCIEDVRIGFGDASGATIFSATRNQDAAGLSGACTLNDASAFALSGDANGIADPQQAGQALVDTNTPGEGLTITLTDSGNPVEGRVIEAVVTDAPAGAALAFDGGTTSGTTNADGEVVFSELVLNTVGSYTIEFRSGSILPVVETFDVGPGPLSQVALVYTDNTGVIEADAVWPGTFGSTDPVVGDADPDAVGIQPAELALQAQDEFGNEVDIAGESYYLVAELLQNGAVSDTALISIDDSDPPVDQFSDAYPARDDTATPPVTPSLIDFATAATDGTFVFTGDAIGYGAEAAGQASNNQTEGSRFRVQATGSGFQIRFTLAENVAALTSNPTAVVETPEFAIEPTVGSISIVENILDPMPAGVDLQGVVSGQAIEVLVLDTNGDAMSNVTVSAVLAACYEGAGTWRGARTDATDPDLTGHYKPIPDADLSFGAGSGAVATGYPAAGPVPVDGAYCTFANGTERGGLFLANDGAAGTGPDPDEDGTRIITAVTNPLGVATFEGATGLQIGVPGENAAANDGYVVAFTAGNLEDGTGGVTAFTNRFGVIASRLASLRIDDDNDLTNGSDAQPFEVDVDTGLLSGDTDVGTGDIFIFPLDKFGNILDVVTPVTVSVVTPNDNRIYLDDGAVVSNLAGARTLSAGSDTPEAADSFVQFAGAGDAFHIGLSGAPTTADTTAGGDFDQDDDPAGDFAATGNAVRLRFSVTGTGISVTSNTFDPTPTP